MVVDPMLPWVPRVTDYRDVGEVDNPLVPPPDAMVTADDMDAIMAQILALRAKADELAAVVNAQSTSMGALGGAASTGALLTGHQSDGSWGVLPGAAGVLRYDGAVTRGVRWSSRLPAPTWTPLSVGTNWYQGNRVSGRHLSARLLSDDTVQINGWAHDRGYSAASIGPQGVGEVVPALPSWARPAKAAPVSGGAYTYSVSTNTGGIPDAAYFANTSLVVDPAGHLAAPMADVWPRNTTNFAVIVYFDFTYNLGG